MLKRDRTAEPFDRHKLGGCLLRAMPAAIQDGHVAAALAGAVHCYLIRRRVRCISSPAILEMALTVLEAAGLREAKARLEKRHGARVRLRSRLRLHHDGGACTAWSKQWLVRQGRSRWGLGRTAARILAGQVEQALVRHRLRDLTRSAAVRLLGLSAAAYGLAPPAAAEVLPRRGACPQSSDLGILPR